MKRLTEAQWSAVTDEAYHILIECARNRQTITYSELSRLLRSAYVHHRSPLFTRLLIDIGRRNDLAGEPSLPALVVAKLTGMPGGGFFTGLAEEHYGDSAKLESYWREELEKVFEYWAE
jgi:hypothetical protein